MSEQRTETRPVVLVSMPWAPVGEPSLGLALLKSSLERKGFSATVVHASAHLLRWVSVETHFFVSECWGLNEFVFTKLLDPDLGDAQLQSIVDRVAIHSRNHRHPRYQTPAALCDVFLTLREEVIPRFLDGMADLVLSHRPGLVGFTCMFDQSISSAALAKLLKERSPELRIAFGGYALEGPPGDVIFDAFPWIDWLVRGDGEGIICDLAAAASARVRVAAGSYELDIDDALARPRKVRARQIDLNDSPVPNYQDWQYDLSYLEANHGVSIRTKSLPIESSRGCWWGQSKHCVFCGIDDETLKYRHKSPEAVMAMLHEMRARHGEDVAFRFSDYIFPKAFYQTLLPMLSEVEPKFHLTAEMKANQTRERMDLFAQAGFTELQPGIESFSTPVLKAMDKGVRGIDNVALLKYGYLNGITIDYNYIYGFPGDCPEDYEFLIERIPRLYHLTPPVSRTEAFITRFAPLQMTPQRFDIPVLPKHHACYDVIFSEQYLSEAPFDLDRYCYYFERHFEYGRELRPLYAFTVRQVNHWKAQHRERPVRLSYRIGADGRIAVRDSRYGPEETFTLSALAGRVYVACDREPTRLTRSALCEGPDGISAVDLQNGLDELNDRRLIWEEDDLCLGIAISDGIADRRLESNWPKQWTSIYC